MRDSVVTLDEFMAFRDVVKELDDVYLPALLTAARAMYAGKDYETALSLGNAFLVDAGRKQI